MKPVANNKRTNSTKEMHIKQYTITYHNTNTQKYAK